MNTLCDCGFDYISILAPSLICLVIGIICGLMIEIKDEGEE